MNNSRNKTKIGSLDINSIDLGNDEDLSYFFFYIRSFQNNPPPKYYTKPTLSDFGLPWDAKAIIDEEEEKRKKTVKRIGLIVFLVFTAICFYYFLNYSYSAEPISNSILCSIGFGLIDLLIVHILKDTKPKGIKELSNKYFNYEYAVAAFRYWREMEQASFWDKLDGHQFEHEVANVFRSQGYNAVVTKGSGDGGVDIILDRVGERIAVQCKAHSRAVGPAVIRDLYGTMTNGGYNKAILVSKNGFTKGVYEFAEGKPIELMSLDNILAMVRKQ